MEIKQVEKNDFGEWLKLGLLLWPDSSEEKLRKEFTDILKSDRQKAFVCVDNEKYIGFINASLRNEYVPGGTSHPVGYIEGIYVLDNYRGKGLARNLFKAGVEWMKSNGCKQVASDTWDWNKDSMKFHEKLGFKEVDRLVHFIREI